MKNNGWTLQEVLDFLKKEFPAETIKNYYKWSAGIHFVYGAAKVETFIPDLNKEYWIPNKYLDWVVESIRPYVIHRNDNVWLNKHRYDRKKSCIWIGPSGIAKTTIGRSTFDSNYYQFSFDGMEDWDSNKPGVILDDFSPKVPTAPTT